MWELFRGNPQFLTAVLIAVLTILAVLRNRRNPTGNAYLKSASLLPKRLGMTAEEIIESLVLDVFGGAHYACGIPASLDEILRLFNEVCVKCTREQMLQAIRNTSALQIVRYANDGHSIYFDEVRDASNWRDFFEDKFYGKHKESGRARQSALRRCRDAWYPRGTGLSVIVPRPN